MPKIPALPPMTSVDTADELPIEDVSAGTTKYITLTKLKEWFQSLAGWITTAMIADANITPPKISSGGFLWEVLYDSGEIGSPADSISSGTITARKNIRVIANLLQSGNITSNFRFNNDSGTNYAFNRDSGDSVSQTSIGTGNSSLDQFNVMDIYNRSASPKPCILFTMFGSANAATAPTKDKTNGKWHNTSAQITRIDAINGGSGDFAAGSRMIVLGRD